MSKSGKVTDASSEWWNLDQAIAWVMTREERIVALLKDGGIALLISYPMDAPYYFHASEERPVKNFWKKFGKKTYADLLDSLRQGKLIAKGIREGYGDSQTIVPDCWEDLTIKIPSLLERNSFSIAVSKSGKRMFWTDIRLKKSNLVKVFKRYPETLGNLMVKNQEDHKKAYIAYHENQISLYLSGSIPKPWQSHEKEEVILKRTMGPGFNRQRFRDARTAILSYLPNSQKTRLSQKDHADMRDFLIKKRKKR